MAAASYGLRQLLKQSLKILAVCGGLELVFVGCAPSSMAQGPTAVAASGDLQRRDRCTFAPTGGRFARGATLPNDAFENNNLMFGVSWRF